MHGNVASRDPESLPSPIVPEASLGDCGTLEVEDQRDWRLEMAGEIGASGTGWPSWAIPAFPYIDTHNQFAQPVIA